MDKRVVQELVKGYSIETTVQQSQRIESFADMLPAGTQLYIAHVPGTDFADTVALAARLRTEGMASLVSELQQRPEHRRAA